MLLKLLLLLNVLIWSSLKLDFIEFLVKYVHFYELIRRVTHELLLLLLLLLQVEYFLHAVPTLLLTESLKLFG